MPEIAPKLAKLDVYQRTPIWCGPKWNPPISPGMRKLFARVPFTQWLVRLFNTSLIELATVFAVYHHKRFPFMTRVAEEGCKREIADAIADPLLRSKLTPQYRFGCKRPTFSNSYYPTFTRDNVELVTDGIAHIESDGIVTVDGKKRIIDTLILATGFSLWERDSFHSIVGKGGSELRDTWERTHYRSYEGITVPGFPNLFYLPAPYSYTGLSYFFTIEGQMKHIARCLTELKRRGARSFEVDASATDAFVERMRERFKDSVFVANQCLGAHSYYFDQHAEPSIIRPTSALAAHHRHASFPLADYHFE